MGDGSADWRVCDAAELEQLRLALVHRDAWERVLASVQAHYGTGSTSATSLHYSLTLQPYTTAGPSPTVKLSTTPPTLTTGWSARISPSAYPVRTAFSAM
jgi:hypothetical protein